MQGQKTTKEESNGIMKFYLVKQGDTLGTIASLYDTTVEEILQLNDVENPELIDPDQAILIPKSAKLCPFSQRENVAQTEGEEALPGQALLVPSREPAPGPAPAPVPTPTPTPIPIPTPVPAPVPTKRYEVQAGDTLFKIAQQFNTSVGTLVSLNNITDPNLIYPGTVILVPDIAS